MADDFEGTPSLEAPDASENMDTQDSPDTSDDTHDYGSDDSSGTEDVATLRREMEELKKRVSGQTLSWQQERDRRVAHEKRLERWKQAGLNPDEIDRAVEASLSQFTGQPAQQNAQQPHPPGVVTEEHLNTVLANQRYVQTCESIAEKYFSKNPDDDNPLFRRQISDAAIRAANLEFQTHGSVISSPEQLMKGAFKELNELKSVVTKRVQKSLSETREKVKGQGVTDTQHRKQRPADDEGEKEMSPEDYVALYRTHQQRVKSKR